MTDTTPAGELRAAADKLRTLAAQAAQPPWTTSWQLQEYAVMSADPAEHPVAEWTYAVATREPQASEQRAECDTANADYIAVMHPGVGHALADWLDAEANTWAGDEVHSRCTPQTCTSEAALAVARAVLGTEEAQR